MIYAIIVEPEAITDLKSIYRYITEQDSSTKATKFVSELHSSQSNRLTKCRIDAEKVFILMIKT